MSDQLQPTIPYRPEVDGLRAVAVLAVMLFHAGFSWFSGGFVGVDVFFVISGYLIGSILIRDLSQSKYSIAKFYERRARRILPALFVVSITVLLGARLFLLPSELRLLGQSAVAVATFVSNIYFWRETDYFAPAAEEQPLLHTWSLSVEEQFYIVFPIALAYAWRFRRRRLVTGLVCVTVVASFGLAVWSSTRSPAANFFLPMTRAWELMLGVLLADLASRNVLVSRSRAVDEAGSAFGALLIVGSIVLLHGDLPFPGAYAVPSVVGTLCILAFASGRTLVGRVLASRALVGIGLVSYSAYLWHQPVFAFARVRTPIALSDGTKVVLLLACMGLAWLTWKFVETPFRHAGLVSRRRLATVSIFGIGTVAALGLALNSYPAAMHGGPRGTVALAERTVRQNKEDRKDAILSGICQFNGFGPSADAESFVRAWNCLPSAESRAGASGQSIPILFVGDSHAADKAMALRQIGLVPGHLGGQNCSLVPSLQTRACRRLFSVARDSAVSRPDIRYIALVNRFERAELSSEALAEVLAYWATVPQRLIFFSEMPTYPGFERWFVRGVPSGDFGALTRVAQESREHLREAPGSAESLRLKFPQSATGPIILDTEAVFCSISDCNPVQAGTPLLIDKDHLSVEGSRYFGAALISEFCAKGLEDLCLTNVQAAPAAPAPQKN